MKKAEAISILATSVRPREAKDRARYDKAVKMAIEALKSSERTAETAQNVSDSDLIFRKMAIEALRECQTYLFDECDPNKKIELRSAERAIEDLPSAQPEQDVLAWLLAHHTKSFELHGRYFPHEVISWLVNDFSKEFIAERREEGDLK